MSTGTSIGRGLRAWISGSRSHPRAQARRASWRAAPLRTLLIALSFCAGAVFAQAQPAAPATPATPPAKADAKPEAKSDAAKSDKAAAKSDKQAKKSKKSTTKKQAAPKTEEKKS